ncbi:MAG: preprotein translocase subunit SecG [Akkermansiaceae bacterium]
MTPIIAANWLNISINLLLVIHVIICLLLALVVLMQRPKQEGLGAAFGGGLTDQAFGARTTDVLQKATVYLGTIFFIITLILAILIGKRQSDNPTLTEAVTPEPEEVVAVEEAPAAPEKPEAAVKMPAKVTEEPKDTVEVPVAPATPPAPEEPVVEESAPAEPKPVEPGEDQPASDSEPAPAGKQ